MNKILIVDDEELIRELLKEIIEGFYSVEVDIAEEGRQALELCNQNDYKLVLTDINMPNGMNGDILIEKLVESGFKNNICVMSGYSDNEFLSIKKYIKKFFKKPLQPTEMLGELKEFF
jgi:YesN/AraC family two-component response regulator